MKFITDLFTGKDGVTWDVGRVSWAASLGGIFAAALANWIHHDSIDLAALGGAVAAICIAHGAALGFKGSTEPDTK